MTLSRPRSRGDEFVLVAARLDREHVRRRPAVAVSQRLGQRLDLDDGAARGVDENGAGFHRRDFGRADHPLRGRQLGHVQRRRRWEASSSGRPGRLARIAQGSLATTSWNCTCMPSASASTDNCEANRAVAHDAELLATHLERVVGRLEPAAPVRHGIFLGHAAQQQDGFGQHQFGHGAVLE